MESLQKVEVYDSEWADVGKMLWLNGIMGDVYLRDEDEYQQGGWAVSVQVTSSRCEWPELVDIGLFKTEEEAMAFAEKVIRKADASYPHISYT
jgi:hypothetical protein